MCAVCQIWKRKKAKKKKMEMLNDKRKTDNIMYGKLYDTHEFGSHLHNGIFLYTHLV